MAVDVDLHLATFEIDKRDIAVGLVEDVLALVKEVVLFANDRLGQLELAFQLFPLLPELILEVGNLRRLLVVIGLKLIDLRQQLLPRLLVLGMLSFQIGFAVGGSLGLDVDGRLGDLGGGLEARF